MNWSSADRRRVGTYFLQSIEQNVNINWARKYFCCYILPGNLSACVKHYTKCPWNPCMNYVRVQNVARVPLLKWQDIAFWQLFRLISITFQYEATLASLIHVKIQTCLKKKTHCDCHVCQHRIIKNWITMLIKITITMVFQVLRKNVTRVMIRLCMLVIVQINLNYQAIIASDTC